MTHYISENRANNGIILYVKRKKLLCQDYISSKIYFKNIGKIKVILDKN